MANEYEGMNYGLRNFQYWDERAGQSRARAEEMLDEEARALMLGIAEMYERLAARAFKNEFLRGNQARNSNQACR